jgi:peptidoglycan LD-endopeptidase CwlK
VIDGLRTQEQQNEYVRTGASKTMNSMHLRQRDGYGHAVDLVPCVYGKPRWEWPLIFQVTAAVRQASIELQVPLVWGGVFDSRLGELGTNLASEVDSYTDRFIAKHGRKPFLDGPHYEMADA